MAAEYLLPCVLGTIIVFSIFCCCHLIPFSRNHLSKIPAAHPLAPFTSSWILWVRMKDQENSTVRAAHEKYGPVIRLGPNELSINCVENGIRTVYGKSFEKTTFYHWFENYGVLNMVSAVSTKPHTALKRKVTHVYSKSYLQNSEHLQAITSEILHKRLLPLLAAHSSTFQPLDILRLSQAISIDAAAAYCFGLSNGTNFLQNDVERRQWGGTYLKAHPPTKFLLVEEFPWLTRWLAKFGIRIVPHDYNEWCLSMCDKAERSLEDTAPGYAPIVYRQLRKTDDKTDYTGFTGLAYISKSAPDQRAIKSPPLHALQRLQIASETLDHIVASHNTLSIALTYVFWELSQHPSARKHLLAELLPLQKLITIQPGSPPPLPTPKSIDELPFLNAIIMETLRLHPPAPGRQPRVTPNAGNVTLGAFAGIPGGVTVQAYAGILHQNPDAFPNPIGWHPERWLSSSSPPLHAGPEEVRVWQGSERKRAWFWAFGSGGRMCVGSNFALQIMKIVVAAVYTNFVSIVVDDEGIEQGDGFLAGPKSGKLILRFERAV